ncbi:hypothetical protein Phum_PHUM284020 [Pediculus humanus corporis]|uniref:Uncharacterized protein n=1 Tax=Pediculus humanus subsp. corporis TaxID=121224 RepID=E0VL80_PEDHC|nr:uncharacterized protein Phum_PHUM284020 [Pediculus humanus corporis]EEB14136.1 hypothetical protein Phum_PHUM284020 [Pediculus humanus corporis]
MENVRTEDNLKKNETDDRRNLLKIPFADEPTGTGAHTGSHTGPGSGPGRGTIFGTGSGGGRTPNFPPPVFMWCPTIGLPPWCPAFFPTGNQFDDLVTFDLS